MQDIVHLVNNNQLYIQYILFAIDIYYNIVSLQDNFDKLHYQQMIHRDKLYNMIKQLRDILYNLHSCCLSTSQMRVTPASTGERATNQSQWRVSYHRKIPAAFLAAGAFVILHDWFFQ